jgi:hypothetical protein
MDEAHAKLNKQTTKLATRILDLTESNWKLELCMTRVAKS